MGYKPSVFKQAKFDYSPLGNIFTKKLDKNDQKEGLFKKLENIKDKNEELLNAFSAANKVSKAAKNESDFNYDSRYAFYRFYRDFEKFKRMVSIDSKHGELKEFYKLLSDFKNHKPITTETKNCKNRILNNVNQLYNKYFDTYKKNYDSEKVKDEEKRGRDYKQFEIIDKKKQKSEWTEEKTKREMQKPLWFEINKKEFEELTGDIYNNQGNDDFKVVINKRTYDLKNAKNIWTEVTTRKTTESETKKLYNELIQKDIDHLEREKSNRFEKYNILNILENVGSIPTGAYLHYKNVPKETIFERSIAERTKLRKERLDAIKKKKKQNINNELFKEYFTDYQTSK